MVAPSSRHDHLNCLQPFPRGPRTAGWKEQVNKIPVSWEGLETLKTPSSSFGNFQNRYSPKWMFRKLSDGSEVKNLPASAGGTGLILGSGRCPRGGNAKHTTVFLPGKPHGQRSLAGYSLWGRKRVRHDSATKQQQHQIFHNQPLNSNHPVCTFTSTEVGTS